MAQWEQLLRLDLARQNQVIHLYKGRFPREIRHRLCGVIESQDWASAAADEPTAHICFHVLLVHLQEQWQLCVQQNQVLQMPDYSGMRDFLLKYFRDKPLTLATILSECLAEEKKILDSARQPQVCQSPTVEEPWSAMDNKVNDLKSQTSNIKEQNRSLERSYKELDRPSQGLSGSIKKPRRCEIGARSSPSSFPEEGHAGASPTGSDVDKERQRRANVIAKWKEVLLQQMQTMLILAQKLVAELTDGALPQWKRRQQLACIGSPQDTDLKHLQNWFTSVAEALMDVRKELHKLQEQSKKYNGDPCASVATMDDFALSLCKNLFSNALVVEKQPVMSNSPQRPLILKTKVHFSISVRFLINLPKLLLKVKPAFDKDVEEATKVKGFRCFELERGKNPKVLDEETLGEGLVADFGDMILKETQGRVKGSSENRRIVEELHVIKFETRLQHAGLDCPIEASTLPLVVVSSSSQVAEAWASVMWYNMVSESGPQNLLLFDEPPPLTWTQLSQVLSWQFFSAGQRELDANQLAELKEKFVDNPTDLVQWSKFSNKESSWFWIDGILDLIKKHLVDLWRDGLIMGFISKEKTRSLLKGKRAGTFVLRFSESTKDGAISFSWVDDCDGKAIVRMVEPYTKDDLAKECLPDSLYLYSHGSEIGRCTNPLLYLYPDVPRDQAFRRYYKLSGLQGPNKTPYLKRNNYSVSFCPTPPPSPPRASPTAVMLMDMDMDMDMDTDHNLNTNQLFQDLPSVLDLLEQSDFLESSPLNHWGDPSSFSFN